MSLSAGSCICCGSLEREAGIVSCRKWEGVKGPSRRNWVSDRVWKLSRKPASQGQAGNPCILKELYKPTKTFPLQAQGSGWKLQILISGSGYCRELPFPRRPCKHLRGRSSLFQALKGEAPPPPEKDIWESWNSTGPVFFPIPPARERWGWGILAVYFGSFFSEI